ncbi:hypothetical protein T484DRAFT_1768469 [Baffinella frigidus]|nr:hypothetical protein T484DRAFT_1768469 [Cryptophyta sp. CCMP2293]
MRQVVLSHLSSSATVEIDASLASFASLWGAALGLFKLPENTVGHLEQITPFHQPFSIQTDAELIEVLSWDEDPYSLFQLPTERFALNPSAMSMLLHLFCAGSTWAPVWADERIYREEAVEQEEHAGEGHAAESDAPRGFEEVVSVVDQRKVRVSLDVGGKTVRTSLATVMEGARQGGEVFRMVCGSLLGPGWEAYEAGGAVPAEVAASAEVQVEFVDNNPRVFSFVLDYLRNGALSSGDAHMLENVCAWAARTGMQALQRACQESLMPRECTGKRMDTGMVSQRITGQKICKLAGGLHLGKTTFNNLRGANLEGGLGDKDCTGASFKGAKSRGVVKENLVIAGNTVDLRGAILDGVDLRGFSVQERTLQDTVLAGAILDNLRGALLEDADLNGVDLEGVDLTGARWNSGGYPHPACKFAGCKNLAKATFDNLCGANMDGVDLNGVDLGGKDCTGASFKGARFGGVLNLAEAKGVHLGWAILAGVDLRGFYVHGKNLSSWNFRGVDLEGVDLAGAVWNRQLRYHHGEVSSDSCKFAGCKNLAKATFDNLSCANMDGVDLNGVDLGGKDCTGASFVGARFGGVLNLGGATGVVLRGAIMEGVDLRGSALRE